MSKTIEILVKVYSGGRKKKVYEEVKDDYDFPSLEEIKEKAGKKYYLGEWAYYIITSDFVHIIRFYRGIKEGMGEIHDIDRDEFEMILQKIKELEEVRGDDD